MRIGLIDVDGKIPNLALMRLSSWYKACGDRVILNPVNAAQVDKVHASVLFTWNKPKAEALKNIFQDIEFGGTGWDLKKTLPDEIEAQRPDYDLYTVKDLMPRLGGIMSKEKRLEKATTLVNAGIGFINRGCPNRCKFCKVPDKEGPLRKVAEIKDLINPRSSTLILLDNNFSASPDFFEKVKEIKERNLTIDITQGIDVRTMTPEIAKALSELKHLRSLHYAFDQPAQERMVMNGIDILSQYVTKWRHLCFVLVGFNSSFDEDMHRYRKLTEAGVDPFIMVYERQNDVRLRHFARWINARIYKACKDFEDYDRWARDKEAYFAQSAQEGLFAAA